MIPKTYNEAYTEALSSDPVLAKKMEAFKTCYELLSKLPHHEAEAVFNSIGILLKFNADKSI
jgi:hypothetical protein